MGKREESAKIVKVRFLEDIEAAWLGALIEGEGSVGLYEYKPTAKDPRNREHWRITVANTDAEIISVFLRLVKTGSVYYYHCKGQLGTKPIFRWHLDRKADVINLCEQIKPYCMKAQKLLEKVA